MSCDIGNLLGDGIGPEVLQIVELAQFGDEDVYHHVTVVHGNPVGVTRSLHEVGLASLFYPYRLADGVFRTG